MSYTGHHNRIVKIKAVKENMQVSRRGRGQAGPAVITGIFIMLVL